MKANYDLLLPQAQPALARFTFATVMSTNPLRIALDEDRVGEEIIILPYSPPSMVGDLMTSDRVLVVRHNGRKIIDDPDSKSGQGSQQLLILGRVNGQSGRIIELGGGVDLDDLTTPNTYSQSQNTDAASGINYPVALAGRLEVDSNEGYAPNPNSMIWQRYTPYGSYGGTFYTRTKYLATWYPWQTFTSDTSDVEGGTVAASTYYIKKADGELWCRGKQLFSATVGVQSYTWTFPVPFVGEFPQIGFIEDTTVPQNVNTSLSSLSLNSVVINHYRSTAVSNAVWFEARGRWK